jgi:hypothetical protein
MVNYAVSLANPALVNSLQGVQYAFLFIASLFLAGKFTKFFPEKFTRQIILQNIIGIGFITIGLYVLAFANSSPQKVTLGITYSPRYATELGLDPRTTYLSMLNDLGPKTVRLPIYWDQIQKDKNGNFDFSDSDFYVGQAAAHNSNLTLAIGYKVPRFPECYIPTWAKNLSPQDFSNALFEEETAIVNHYKDNPSVKLWQVENEILFPFGKCPEGDFGRLKQEVSLTHQLDSARPVMVTESGEFGLWLTTARTADIVGTSLYRRTLSPYAIWFKSPLPPFFYQMKANIVHLFFPDKKIYVSELQAEPWANVTINKTPLSYQLQAFPANEIAENVKFTEESGFDTVYLWGAEWWYYLDKLGHPEYLNNAAMIFKDSN